MNHPTPVMTIPLRQIWKVVIGPMLFLPLCIFVVSIALAVGKHNSDWLTLGGNLIAAVGAWHWAARLFRVPPNSADNPLPPLTLPDPEGRGPGQLLNSEALDEMRARIFDNYRSRVGVLLAIIGGICASTGPMMFKLFSP